MQTQTVSSLPTIGSRIRYTGDMANISGDGFVVASHRADQWQQAGCDVALDDGRFFRRVSHFDEGAGCRFVTVANGPVADPADLLGRLRTEEAKRKAYVDAQAQAKSLAEQEVALGTILAAQLLGDCKAVIVARLKEDKSDIQTDYFASSTTRTVVLAVSKHTRCLFPEMRKAAARLNETAHLVAKGIEHRENYSMGAGTYLSDSDFRHDSGWEVRKMDQYQSGWDHAILRALATGNHTL